MSRHLTHRLTVPVLVLVLAACGSRASTLQPRGPHAEVELDLHWLMFSLAAVVFLIVLGLLLYAIYLPRRRADGSGHGVALVVAGGLILPLTMLPIVWAATLSGMQSLAEPDAPPAMAIEVIGHQWWYEVRYAGAEETAVNEIRIPVGKPVRIELTSADVIHSFWVPQLAGKQDMIPGETHTIWIQASEPGVYIGRCAEFCGLHHTTMTFRVVAG